MSHFKVIMMVTWRAS